MAVVLVLVKRKRHVRLCLLRVPLLAHVCGVLDVGLGRLACGAHVHGEDGGCEAGLGNVSLDVADSRHGCGCVVLFW